MICGFFAIMTFQKEFVIRKTYVIRDSAILFVQNIYETVGSFTKHSMSETIATLHSVDLFRFWHSNSNSRQSSYPHDEPMTRGSENAQHWRDSVNDVLPNNYICNGLGYKRFWKTMMPKLWNLIVLYVRRFKLPIYSLLTAKCKSKGRPNHKWVQQTKVFSGK